MNQKELDSLIHLLDDPDDQIYVHVKDKLMAFGRDVIPVLENAWESKDFGEVFQSRVEDLIQSIQYDGLYEALVNWKKEGCTDLLTGMLLVDSFQYPDLDHEAIHRFFDVIQQDVWIELNNNLTALEKVRIINHILFEVHNLDGDTSDYHALSNSFLSQVIESRKGNPISLAIIYMLLAQKLNLPIYGVNLPKHFILAYVDEDPFLNLSARKEKQVLFYINPFSKGAVFGKPDIRKFLEQLKLDNDPAYFKPCDNLLIVRRVFNNLIYSYELSGREDKANHLKRLAEALK